MSEGLIATLVICGFLLSISAIIFLVWRAAKKRSEAFAQCAQKMGFNFREDGSEIIAQLAHCHLFSQGRSREVYNVIEGTEGICKIAVFDYRYTTGSGKNSSTTSQTVVWIQADGLHVPNFQIRPENFFHKIGGMFVYQDIDIEEYPEFSKKYILRGAIEEDVREAFSEAVIKYFEEHTWSSAESESDSIFIYQAQKRYAPDEIEDRIRNALNLVMCFLADT